MGGLQRERSFVEHFRPLTPQGSRSIRGVLARAPHAGDPDEPSPRPPRRPRRDTLVAALASAEVQAVIKDQARFNEDQASLGRRELVW